MINIPAIPEGLEIPEKTELWGREETMPSAEPVKGQSRNGTEASWPVSAWKSVPWREIELPFARRPAQDSSGQGKCNIGSRGCGDEPYRSVRHIADSRRGRQPSRDAHAATTAPPLASRWPTVQKTQYVATIGSFFGLQRYNFFRKRPRVVR